MTEVYTYHLSREDYDHISNYDGNPLKFNKFIQSVESVYNLVCATLNEKRVLNHSKLLIKVKARLEGSAEQLILSKSIDNVPDLIEQLNNGRLIYR
jgi:hypothetical protein